MHKRALCLLALLSCAGVSGRASADDVHLVGGSTIEGKVTRHADKVSIETESGSITLSVDSIDRVERRESNVQRFDRMYAQLGPKEIEGRLELADFCRDHEMHAREQQLLREILDHDTDNAQARARLGYVKSDGAWITRDSQQRARGLVLHEGAWVTRQQALELERAQAQAEIAARERDKARTELETKQVELRRQQLELEAARENQTRARGWPAPVGAVYVAPTYSYPAANGCGYGQRCSGATVAPRSPSPAARDTSWPSNGVRDPRDTSWPVNGVRDPRDMSWPSNGVRDPSQLR